ncbi:MAG TPA: nucleotidyltransferase domain-containing protein [Nitrososphaera sp.]|jgi:predicted nucleotidyltransferase|nr:nucleotidyltransferase domain-containing protein [Nitrososphaera sp.]
MSDIEDMQFHNYLESLLGSRVSISLIRTLINYSGKIFTVRKLAEAAAVSSSEAAIAVQELEKFGILRIQPVGRSYLISLNNNSYILTKILRPTIKAEEGAFDELVSILKRNLRDKNIISAALFGSVAMKREREDSDIDLLVISNDFEAASMLTSKAREEISSVFNSRLSPLIMSERELIAKKNGRLVRSILSSYIAVAGKDLAEIIGKE